MAMTINQIRITSKTLLLFCPFHHITFFEMVKCTSRVVPFLNTVVTTVIDSGHKTTVIKPLI